MRKHIGKRLLSAVSVTLALLLFAAIPFTLGIFAGSGEPSPAADTFDVWDGESVTVGWYAKAPTANSYTLSSASDLVGLSYLVSHRNNYIYYDGQTGLVDSPEEYYTAAQADKKASGLKELHETGSRLMFENISIKLDVDVDLAGKPFLPIGASGSFCGKFDGQNHTVKNILITAETAKHHSGPQMDFGFFGILALGGSVSNLRLENEVLDATGTAYESFTGAVTMGGLAASIHNSGGGEATNVTIVGLNVKVGKRTTGQTYVGAILGAYAGGVDKTFQSVNVKCYTVTKAEGAVTSTVSTKNFYGTCTKGEEKEVFFKDCAVTVGHGEGSWVNTDGEEHWKVCSVCGSELEGTRASHNPTEWKQTDDKTKHYQVCECGYQTAAVAHDSLSYEDNGDGNTHKVTCGTCSQEVNAEEAHTWEWKPVPGEAKEKATCEKCGAEGETRDTHEHKPVKHDAKAATCTEDGNPEYYTCEGEGDVCTGKYYKDNTCTTEYTAAEIVLKATGHNKGAGLTKHEAKAATCQAEGNTEYYSCEVCGKYFKAADGKEEIADKGSVTLAKTAHSYKDGVCTVCGEADPNYTAPDTSDATLLSGAVLLTVTAVAGCLLGKRKKSR